MTTTTLQASNTALNQEKSVYLNNSKKYYTKLDNRTLRLKIPGEDTVTAKDIYLDGLTAQDDWLFTTQNIADRWGIALKTARKKMTLLSNAGLAKHEKVIDPKTHKFILHIWHFYENPLPPKKGSMAPYDQTIEKKAKSRRKPKKSITPQTGGNGTYIENKQQNKQQSVSPVEKSKPQIEKFNPPQQKKAIADGLKKIRSKLPNNVSQNLSNTFMTNAFLKYGLAYLLLIAEECRNQPNPLRYFTKGIHKKGGYEKFNRIVTRQAEDLAIKENIQHKHDIEILTETMKTGFIFKDMEEKIHG